ncbi:MAG: aminotransferase class III-fold pyridoxal phosphate-dependent enzyme [Candidatus Aminicenantes bacterium]|nr:aminotransferase class III-fold pyridoxal phosphate-dependent enzyme [Candidatus Aminicenantes bacterium]
MNDDARARLIAALEDRYRRRTPKGFRIHERARKVMVRGGSHTLRLWSPYPVSLSRAKGALIWDADANAYTDYWQGHYANILGHNPAVVLRALRGIHEEGALQTGFEEAVQIELAEIIQRQLGWEGNRVRFTTSGTLATMYAVMLAEAYTGRELVLKVGGGWHGASPYLLKGVHFDPVRGFDHADSAGVPSALSRKTLVTRFGDLDSLKAVLKAKGDRIACFIVEPFLGAGGFLPAPKDYLREARRLTERYGVLLIFDEIISGFRFAPTGLQTLYGIRPDLSTLGKLIGGGHAVSAVVGRADIMGGCEARAPRGRRVVFEGGTFSAHAEYVAAGLALVKHLIRHADEVYPRLARLGERLRRGIASAFAASGIEARCTGGGNDVVPGSSLFFIHFPRSGAPFRTVDDLHDPRVSDADLRERILKLALLNEGVHVMHGGGAVSTAHDDAAVLRTIDACAEVGRLFKTYA